jgi:glycosyltransferase involved in cell wall biosynthesis
MHIAVLTDGISPYVLGGMQRHSFYLVNSLLQLGEEITLVHSVGADQNLPSNEEVKKLFTSNTDKLHIIGLKFPNIDQFPGHYLRESYRYSCEVFESLKHQWEKFDFIYAKGFTAWCILEKKTKGFHMAPVGIKFHGYEMYQKTTSIKGKLEQFMFKPPVIFNTRNANIVFSYGGEITAIIKKIGVEEDRIAEITGGVDDSWLSEKKLEVGSPRKFVFVGRAERRKGISDLNHAVKKLDVNKVEFHWIGPIPEDKKLSLSNCFYHGLVSDVEELQKILDKMDVLVLPSHAEGMPNVVLEAMARGCAIIATEVGAVSMMVSDKNGKLIEPGNRNDLIKSLRAFTEMSDEDLLEKREASRTLVRQKFLWSHIAKQTQKVIGELTHSSRSEIND